jgi:protoheme IX farnesyltransferase
LVGLYEDYESRFFMLPTGKDKVPALQVILYTGWLIIASLLPSLGYTGELFISPVAAVVIFLLGVWMLFYAVKLYKLERQSG